MPEFDATQGFERLWRDVHPDPPTHEIDLPALGEYVVLFAQAGADAARAAFPSLAAHLDTHCATCIEALSEIAGATDRARRITRAFDAQAALRPSPGTPPDSERDLPPEVQRYRQRRWDVDLLVDAAHLDSEVRRRLPEA